MERFPLSHWEENIIFDDKGNPNAVYKIPLSNYNMANKSQKISIFDRMDSFVRTIGKDFKLLSFCKMVSPDAYSQQHKNLRQGMVKVPDQLNRIYDAHVNDASVELAHFPSWKRSLYLVIPLPGNTLLDKLTK